jgi:HEAT repeat protein
VVQAPNDNPSDTNGAIVADPAPIEAVSPQASSGKPASRNPSEDRKKKQQDLPDVSLVIPEETRPEVKAIIKANVASLSSTRASERVKAAQVLGELGEQGKPVRRPLCRALLDPTSAVRVAAADALKNIDPRMQHLAVAFMTTSARAGKQAVDPQLLEKIRQLGDDAEPLTPLVVRSARLSAAAGDPALADTLTTLSYIASNDHRVYKLIVLALSNPGEDVRYSALEALVRMKHARLAVRQIIRRLRTDTPRNRVAAIKALTVLSDPSTEEMVAGAIAGQRYHEDESVRHAVEVALNKLQNNHDP